MSALAKGPLTVAETEFLAQCEEAIDAGLMTFVEVGQALLSIRDNRLYRSEFPTFEDYCAQRWQISRPRAYALMSAADAVSCMQDIGLPAPTSARQAEELARVPEEKRADVWKQTLDATEGKPTAAAVREVARGVDEVNTPADHPVTTDQPAVPPAEAAGPAPAAAEGAEVLGLTVEGPENLPGNDGPPTVLAPAPSAPSPLAGDVAAAQHAARTAPAHLAHRAFETLKVFRDHVVRNCGGVDAICEDLTGVDAVSRREIWIAELDETAELINAWRNRLRRHNLRRVQ